MADIQYTKTGGIIKWGMKDILEGLDPNYGITTNVNGHKLINTQGLDPYRNIGYATPGYAPADLTNVSVVDALQLDAVVNGAYGYSIGGVKVHQIDIVSEAITTPTNFPHTISGATAGHDVVVYAIKVASAARANYLLYSWNSNIGIYDFTTTFDDDWMSTVPANAAAFDTANQHNFIVGDDDICYVTDANNIHAIDGSLGNNSTLTKNVWTLPKGYIAVGFAKIQPTSIVVFAYKNVFGTTSSDPFYLGQATAFFFNYNELDPYKTVELNDNFVGAPFMWNGTIGCFTEGRIIGKNNNTKTSRLKIWNGTEFKTVFNYIGGVPSIGGVDIQEKQIVWSAGGDVFQYGNNLEQPVATHKILRMTGTSNGLIKTLSQQLQIMSTGATTSGGMQQADSNFYSNCSIFFPVVVPEFPPGYRAKVDKVSIKFLGSASGGLGVTLTLNDQDTTSYTILSALTAVVAGKLTIDKLLDSSSAELPEFNRIRASLAYASGASATVAPVVGEIVLEYSLRTLTP